MPERIPPNVGTSRDDVYFRHGARLPTAGQLLQRARSSMFAQFMAVVQPDARTTILDVGVSTIQEVGANTLEWMYPWPANITCAGLDSAEVAEAALPGFNYRQVASGSDLPFDDGQFDVVYSNAVLEHVGGRDARSRFVRELRRVGKRVYLTIPNRWFPVEHHTGIPLLHFAPALFRSVLKHTPLEFWTDIRNLDFIGRRDLMEEITGLDRLEYAGIRLGAFSSNVMAYMDQRVTA